MSELSAPRRPGVALLGYGTTLLMMITMLVAFQSRTLDDLGWHGGEYAETFLAVTGGSVVVGAGLWTRPPGSPWRSFGFGMVLGGLTGGVFVVLVVVLFWVALSHASIPF
jgi:hypothetical protein